MLVLVKLRLFASLEHVLTLRTLTKRLLRKMSTWYSYRGLQPQFPSIPVYSFYTKSNIHYFRDIQRRYFRSYTYRHWYLFPPSREIVERIVYISPLFVDSLALRKPSDFIQNIYELIVFQYVRAADPEFSAFLSTLFESAGKSYQELATGIFQ